MRQPTRLASSRSSRSAWSVPCRRWLGALALGLGLAGMAVTAHAAEPLKPSQVPDPLKTWIPWALHDLPDWQCPPAFDDQAQRFCAWPGPLQLEVQAHGGRFSQRWHAVREDWVALPGGDGQWPQDVQLDGRPVAVLRREGVPSVRLPAGEHRLEGQWSWVDKPESLALPATAALVQLSLAGKPVAEPVRDDANRLWLGRQQADAGQNEEQAQVQVHRKWVDGVPMRLHTRFHLEVSGKSRELTVARGLLPGWVPQELNSPLPATVAPDGSLRVQARAGVWDLTLVSRHPGRVESLGLPALAASPPAASGSPGSPGSPGEGPRTQGKGTLLTAEEEVWAFEAAPQLRTVSLDGAPPVDPTQTTLPGEWRKLPTYLMQPGATLNLKEQRRGDADPASDKLALTRRAWLSFDGRTMTFHDRMTGRVNQATRLEVSAPAQLGRADVDGADQLITQGSSGLTGLELRRGPLTLSADSVAQQVPRTLPAVGWQQDFDSVTMQLSLPAGWRLLHASGVDRADGAWLSRWNLLDFFVVLVMTLTVGRLWGARLGAVAFVMVVLSYHEAAFPLLMWLPLLVAAALGRVMPESLGKALRLTRWVERLSLGVLLLLCLQFAVSQVRTAMYPVLEQPYNTSLSEEVASYAPAGMSMPMAAAPAPAMETPAMEKELRKARSRDWQSYSQDKSLSQNQSQAYRNVDPNAQVQTGPGLPAWTWHDYRLQWDGPVLHDQSLRLWLLPPWAQKLLTVLRLGLLAVLLASLARHARRRPPSSSLPPSAAAPSGAGTPPGKLPGASLATALVAACLPVLLTGGLALGGPSPAHATAPQPLQVHAKANHTNANRPTPVNAGTNGAPTDAGTPGAVSTAAWPSPELLTQLKERLTAEPDCLPQCAGLSRLTVVATGTSLRLGLEVDADREIAIPVPGGVKHWVPREVRANGRPEVLMRGEDGRLWLLIGAGHQRIDLLGDLPAGRDTLQLPLPLKPHQVQVQAAGWDVEGLNENEVADTFQLSRQRKTDRRGVQSGGDGSEVPVLPAYLRVERRLFLDLVWRVETTVRRESPRGMPVLAQVPLLPGEAVTSGGINVRDNKVQVNLGPQSDSVSWSSTLAPTASLALTASAFSSGAGASTPAIDPNQTPWAESWWVDASTMWHVGLQGLPPAASEASGETALAFYPWPGETLTLQIDRPQAVAGQTLTIDRANWVIKPGTRATDYELTLSLRSSRGLDHVVTLPEGASLQQVLLNGQPRALRAQGQRLTLPVLPGKQSVGLTWRVEQDMGLRYRTQPVLLGMDSVNHRVSLTVPANRWLLWAHGPGLGPAILFWGVLLVFLGAGLVLARTGRRRRVPLTTLQWLLLMLGLTQVSPWACALVVGWFFALAWRGDPSRGTAWTTAGSIWRFNLTQIALVGSTLLMLGVLCYAVAGGLLGQPDMQVMGNGSSSNLLYWIQDRVGESLSPVTLITVPLLVYRGLMLVWALWLAWSLLNWLRWGWGAWSWGTVWREGMIPPVPQPPSAPLMAPEAGQSVSEPVPPTKA